MTVDRAARSAERLDRALEDSFPASDPVFGVNPSIGIKTSEPIDESLDARIRVRAEKLWCDAGSPADEDHSDFLDDARMLIAIEDNPKAGTLPNPMTLPDRTGPEDEPIEPTEEVANEGEFPNPDRSRRTNLSSSSPRLR